MMARLRLTTKQVGGGYYKGNRTGAMGFFAKNGTYVIDWKKVRTYAVPEGLDAFKVGSFFPSGPPDNGAQPPRRKWMDLYLQYGASSSLPSLRNSWRPHKPGIRRISSAMGAR